jgi:hypothetical protein
MGLAEEIVKGVVVPGKIGTYGFIRGAKAFVAGCAKKAPFGMEDFGYCMEGIVLRATEADLETCWLGGTLDRGGTTKIMEASQNEIVPAILSLGYAAKKRRVFEKFIRNRVGSVSRKEWDELFFDESFDKKLTKADAGQWADVLECVRLSPSASNKQPWRILRKDSQFHLYLCEDVAYNAAIRGVRIQNMDMGIAMRHFEEAARSSKLPGSWKRLEQTAVPASERLTYIATWK